jgi:hypothetical protein
MSDFLLPVVALSPKQERNIQHILNQFLQSFLVLNKKDENLNSTIQEDKFESQYFDLCQKSWQALVKNAFQHVLKLYSVDISIKQIFVELFIMLTVYLLVNSTNEYIRNTLKLDVQLNVEKAYQTYKRRNEKDCNLLFLSEEKDISLEDRLYILSSLAVNQIQMVLSIYYLDFFTSNKRKIQGYLQVKQSKQHVHTSSAKSMRSTTTTTTTRERKKKILNIQLDNQVSYTNHIIKSQPIKLIS